MRVRRAAFFIFLVLVQIQSIKSKYFLKLTVPSISNNKSQTLANNVKYYKVPNVKVTKVVHLQQQCTSKTSIPISYSAKVQPDSAVHHTVPTGLKTIILELFYTMFQLERTSLSTNMQRTDVNISAYYQNSKKQSKRQTVDNFSGVCKMELIQCHLLNTEEMMDRASTDLTGPVSPQHRKKKERVREKTTSSFCYSTYIRKTLIYRFPKLQRNVVEDEHSPCVLFFQCVEFVSQTELCRKSDELMLTLMLKNSVWCCDTPEHPEHNKPGGKYKRQTIRDTCPRPYGISKANATYFKVPVKYSKNCRRYSFDFTWFSQ